MKQRRKLTRVEKRKLSKLLNEDLSYKSNREILITIRGYEKKENGRNRNCLR